MLSDSAKRRGDILKLSRLLILALVLVVSITACSNQKTGEELLSSEDLPYKVAVISTRDYEYEIYIESWEFVNQDMIRVVGNYGSWNYDFLVNKANVTFLTDTYDE